MSAPGTASGAAARPGAAAGSRPGPPVGDGVLVVDKGPGVTSFQVVAHLRRVLRVPKMGHGGTLDPLATGVLPILLGAATKLASYLLGQDKEYLATVRLGVTTDTLDAAGRVLTEQPVPPLEEAALRAVLARFQGEIEQVPPMFSALHAGGRRLHELARAGIEVPRTPRRVRIHALELLEWAPPQLRLRVACGSGTYVRSLAADLGAVLGCGAHLEALRRTRLGSFTLAEAAPWEAVRQGNPAVLAAHLLPPDRAVTHLPAAQLDPAAAIRLSQGQRLAPAAAGIDPALEGPCRLYAGGAFIGIGEVRAGSLRPLRLLHAADPRAPALPR